MNETLPNPYYHQLDTIADAYTPLLLILALACVARLWWQQRWALASVWRTVASVLWVAFVSYGVMSLDKTLNIWPKWRMDYSTHTAVAGGLTILITALLFTARHINLVKGVKSKWEVIAALAVAVTSACYFALMVYQQYHSFADIFTTFVVTGTLQYWGLTTFLPPLSRSAHKLAAL